MQTNRGMDEQRVNQLDEREPAEDAAQNRPVNLIKVKLPEFNSTNPEVYIRIVEAIFNARRILTQRRRYVLLLESLSAEQLARLTAFLDNGGAEPYNVLRNGLIETFGQTAGQKLQELLNRKAGNWERPSEILASIKLALNLAPGEPIENEATRTLVKNLLVSKLPKSHRLHLSVYLQVVDPDELARVANALHDSAPKEENGGESSQGLEKLIASNLARLQLKIENMEESLKKREGEVMQVRNPHRINVTQGRQNAHQQSAQRYAEGPTQGNRKEGQKNYGPQTGRGRQRNRNRNNGNTKGGQPHMINRISKEGLGNYQNKEWKWQNEPQQGSYRWQEGRSENDRENEYQYSHELEGYEGGQDGRTQNFLGQRAPQA